MKNTMKVRVPSRKEVIHGNEYIVVGKNKRNLITSDLHETERKTVLMKVQYWDRDECKVFEWYPSWNSLRNICSLAIVTENTNYLKTGYDKELKEWHKFLDDMKILLDHKPTIHFGTRKTG